MSGGFFRGTSAEQDTRFSNKQAKLLKSQRFAPELDQPVDMTKVKMDVIRPWIATRATELLGFEDEVLINFVYGLLDGKEVDGKQIQIQLTGFLEKNTGKFMKELWGLLLSAQNNASGVPQQFLDAKEEEMKKKKVESDRITQEIQKRKEREGREFEQEKQKRTDVEAGNSRYANAVSGSSSRHSLPKDSRVQSEKERDMEPVHSPRSKGRGTSPSRSFRKSPSKSGNSKEGGSRSASLSSQSRGRSISPSKRHHSPSRHSVSSERRHRSHVQRSISPLHKYSPRNNRSPHLRRESPHARRRSHSTPRHISPPPIRRRSPYGRRSPSSLRHRSPPSRHRSPALNRRGSPSLGRHRRSPSPGRRRRSPSPGRRRRSPSLGRRRRSPSLGRRRRSPSPARRRSPSPVRRRRSPSPVRRRRSPSPRRGRRSPSLGRRRRSPSPGHRRRSPSPFRHRRSPSPAHRRISLSPDRRSPSPVRSRRSAPARNRSPPLQRRMSPSPSHRRSPTRRTVSPVQCRSLSPPMHSPLDRSPQEQVRSPHSPRYHAADSQVSPRAMKRSHSPYSSSPSNLILGDSNRVQTRSNGFESKKYLNKHAHERRRAHEKSSSIRDALHKEATELADSETLGHAPHQLPCSSRSVSRDSRDNDNHGKDAGAMSDNSSERSSSPRYLRTSPLRNRLPETAVKQTEKQIPRDISGMNGEKKQATHIRERAYHKTDSSSKKGTDGQPSNMSSDEEIGHNDMDLPKMHAQVSGSLNDREYGAGRVQGEKNSVDFSRQQFFHSASVVELQPDSRNDAYRDSHYLPESVKKSKRKMDTGSQVYNFHSDSEETDAHKHRSKEKRKHKHRRDSGDTSESDSHAEDRRDAKRRRKDERRLRKEEKRRKREEKHRKRLERHRGKQQLKSMDTVTPPSDFEMDGVSSKKRSDALETDSEEKRLEIELRERALESLRARKAVGH